MSNRLCRQIWNEPAAAMAPRHPSRLDNAWVCVYELSGLSGGLTVFMQVCQGITRGMGTKWGKEIITKSWVYLDRLMAKSSRKPIGSWR